MSSTTTVGRHAAAAVAPRPSRRGLRRAIGVLTDLVLLGCLLVFALLAVGPHLLGYRTSTMLTGSMEPGISAGDVVVTTAKPAADVEVGDVITYQIPIEDHRVETHRVVEVLHRDGSIAIRTKGDANDNADPWTATLQDDQVWEVRAVVPELGTAIRVLRAPAVQHGVFWAALAGLLALGLTTVWRRDAVAPTVTDADDQKSDPA